MRLKTFKLGGIHPPENKLSAGEPIKTFCTETMVSIPLGQHIGAAAEPVVKRGDTVKVGTLIAKSSAFVSANIHSSVSGKVMKIDRVTDASGYTKDAIFIKPDGEDSWEENILTKAKDHTIDLDTLSPITIINTINQCGVVGLGGATFPSHIKLMTPKDSKAEVLIINAVECEPYLTSDHRLMLENPEEILKGVQVLMRALDVDKAIIGIENNKQDAINLLREKAEAHKGISIQALQVKYPQGGEKQLIKALISKEIKSGALPISVGAVVQNVGTAFAVYEAIYLNKPLIERVVTITGKPLDKTYNFKVRIGTSIDDILSSIGGLPEATAKLVSGGPMMGKALATASSPITKGTSGVLILEYKDTKREKMRACIRCTKCVNVCPMGLNPAFLMRDVTYKLWEEVEKRDVVDCIECGSCSYTCPANRPLLDQIRYGKQTVMGIIRSRKS